ncbi:MAG TPA: MBL fold metallo-hydrolase [Mesorhizobium sp.]|jgi:glyoxylase-like metal-dependent hydrolase (beta-lactamase superfamily II)|nr:MBL fold metallo-hydrolase [Mesorhizobium sp.]
MTPEFDRAFEPRHGEPVTVAPTVRRLTARNPSPFTFAGTNTYLVGGDAVAVIDPGPDLEEHFQALRRALGGGRVTHVFVSHTHRDHSPLAARLSREFGATVLAQGPHRAARLLAAGEENPLDASADSDFMPDRELEDGELVQGEGWAIRTVLTPGHAANHACFALEGSGILFSADHVMAWATTVVAPPDGDMADYMRSLDKLLARDDRLLLPGHGGPVRRPKTFMRGLKAHRRMRERAILARLEAGSRTIGEIVSALYQDTDPLLHGAAAWTVLAHLEDLSGRGLVRSEGPPGLGGRFALA